METGYIPGVSTGGWGPSTQPKAPEIAPATYKHNLIDTRKTPVSDIITAIRGAPWTVVYYGQVLGASQQPQSFQITQTPTFQQYRQINNLVLAVQNPLQSNQDTSTTEFTVTGTAITYPYLTPIKFDHFVAPVRDGRLGLFVINEVRRLSMWTQAVYEIEYELVDQIDHDLQAALDARVVDVLYFNMNLLRSNVDPYLTPEQNVEYAQLTEQYRNIGQVITRLFYDRYTNVLLIPTQATRVWDPFHIRFLQAMYGGELPLTQIKSMTHYRIESLTAHRELTIYDLLINRSTAMHGWIAQKIKPLTKNAFARYVQYGSVAYSNIDYVVMPVVPSIGEEAAQDIALYAGGGSCGCTGDGSAPSSEDGWFIDLEDSEPGSTLEKTIVDPFSTATPPDMITVPYLHPVTIDDYYIFSEAFYNSLDGSVVPGCSIMEMMVLDYLQRRPLDSQDLFALVQDMTQWSPLQRFYYLPILALLLRAFTGDI